MSTMCHLKNMQIYVGILTVWGIIFSIPSTHARSEQESSKTWNSIVEPSTIPNLCNGPKLISLLNLYPAVFLCFIWPFFPTSSSSGFLPSLVQFTHALNKHATRAISAIVNLCNLLSHPLTLPNLLLCFEEAGFRLVVEEAGCWACEQLSSCERVVGEVSSPGGSPVAAKDL
jgi:hypothetical protein